MTHPADPVPESSSPARWKVWARRVVRVCKISFVLTVSIAIIGGLVGVALVAREFRKAGLTIDSVPALTDPSKAPLPQPIRYLSADGQLLGKTGPTEQRIVLSPRDIPQVMRQSIVAIEDQRFYRHRGVDFQSLLRAAWIDLRAGSAAQGASTITMQYIRNVYLDFQKTAHRKLSEIALALQLEAQWDKPRILSAYLNTIYLGDGAYGIEAASQRYFGHPASQLRLHEAALLAGVIQSPENLNPRRHTAAARARQATVLDEMFAQGMITRRQADEAKRQRWNLRPLRKTEKLSEPALVELLERETRRRLDGKTFRRGGFTVRASFAMKDIDAARVKLRAAYADLPKAQRPVIAASFVDPATGRIRVIAHSRSQRSFFDYAAQARRQPGSTVKAFTAAQYLREGGKLSDPISNDPLKVAKSDRSTYTVQPTTGQARNVFDMLRFSQNPQAWRLYQKTGGKDVLRLERRLGVKGLDSNPAAALGGVRQGTNTLEMASAFAVFAAEGQMRQSHAVVRITDLLGNSLWTDQQLRKQRRLEAEYSRQLTVGLRRVVSEGFPQLKASLPVSRFRPLAGKTGTSENHADAWFAGYTPNLAGAVWTGFGSSRRSLANLPGGAVWGSTVPARTFSSLSSRLLAGTPVRRFRNPTGVQRVPHLLRSGRQAAQARLARLRFFNTAFVAVFDPHAAPGTVLKQSPRAGTWVAADTPVKVSYATNQRPAPNLVGQGFTEAESQLGSFAKVKVTFKVSDQPVGTVLEQAPYAGTPLTYKGTMAVTVATSPGPIRIRIKKVPYVPSDSELADLRSQLKDAEQRADDASRKVRVRVPDLQGMQQSTVEQVLSSLGLQLSASGTGAAALEQRPAAGEPVSDGQTIYVKFG